MSRWIPQTRQPPRTVDQSASRSFIKRGNLRQEKMVSEHLHIAIVGGGIGGLVAALALRARGLDVTVYEQGGELREVGAGISIFPNAMLLLHRIGVADEIEKIGCPMAGLVMRTSTGEFIHATTPPPTGIQGYDVHRAEFLKLLADAQPKGTLHLGHRLSGAREAGDRVCLS